MAETARYPRLSSFETVEAFRRHLGRLGIDLACDDQILTAPVSPLAQSFRLKDRIIGNRFAAQPMEGWDGTAEGLPTDLTRRRWRNFGRSGAKLIWGGEACAVVPEGRANPRQLMAREETRQGLADLLQVLREGHREMGEGTDDLLVGLQLTHSGRFCRPWRHDQPVPAILYHHPILDRKFGIPADYPLLSDAYLERLIEEYIRAAKVAYQVGFQFVDLKHCHGYLGHELLSAFTRPGRFGGSFENRTRFCRELIQGIRAEVPGLWLGVRLSAFDLVPFRPDPTQASGKRLGPGIPEPYQDYLPYYYAFGAKAEDPLSIDLTETFRLVEMLAELGVELVNLSCGSPYYNPHLQRPALFPPSDGYQPPEDPLVGVARQLEVVAAVKARFPALPLVGSGYTYLQEYLPHVAQAQVRLGRVDFVGLGRMMLAYPEFPRQVLEEGKVDRRRLCRTFSDCTTAPRHGMVSGCFPLDPFYRERPEAERLKEIKAGK